MFWLGIGTLLLGGIGLVGSLFGGGGSNVNVNGNNTPSQGPKMIHNFGGNGAAVGG